MTLPGPARSFIKLLPISFVPGGHFFSSRLRTQLPSLMTYAGPRPLDAALTSRVHSFQGCVRIQNSHEKNARELLVYATICGAQDSFFSTCFKPGTSKFVLYSNARSNSHQIAVQTTLTIRGIPRMRKVRGSKDVKFCEYYCGIEEND